MWERDYISDLAGSRFGVEPEELSEITENHEVFRVLLGPVVPVILSRGKINEK